MASFPDKHIIPGPVPFLFNIGENVTIGHKRKKLVYIHVNFASPFSSVRNTACGNKMFLKIVFSSRKQICFCYKRIVCDYTVKL